MTTAKNAVIFGTVYFLLYLTCLNISALFSLMPWLFIGSPFLLIWMVINILKDTRQPYPELREHEWGYRDKKREELGIF
jgi:predicted tellurium resistance membrane protein TerC